MFSPCLQVFDPCLEVSYMSTAKINNGHKVLSLPLPGSLGEVLKSWNPLEVSYSIFYNGLEWFLFWEFTIWKQSWTLPSCESLNFRDIWGFQWHMGIQTPRARNWAQPISSVEQFRKRTVYSLAWMEPNCHPQKYILLLVENRLCQLIFKPLLIPVMSGY